jgi:hypothetical protein
MKKVLIAVVIVFVAFFLYQQPTAAADVLKGAFSVLGNVLETFIEFLNALFD